MVALARRTGVAAVAVAAALSWTALPHADAASAGGGYPKIGTVTCVAATGQVTVTWSGTDPSFIYYFTTDTSDLLESGYLVPSKADRLANSSSAIQGTPPVAQASVQFFNKNKSLTSASDWVQCT